jgi:hypothetical protein
MTGEKVYSNGPDCRRGPNCCCGYCNFRRIGECDTSCCKCTPRDLCLTWTPDTPSESCIEKGVKLSGQSSGINWGGSLEGIDDSMTPDNSVLVQIYKDPYDVCYWRLTIPARDITVDVLIVHGSIPCDGEDTRVTCQKPRIVIEDFVLQGCSGTLVVERKLLETVPFEREVEAETAPLPIDHPCTDCGDVCTRICLEYHVGDVVTKEEFVLTGEFKYAFTPPGGETSLIEFVPNPYTGECELVLNHVTLTGFAPFPIPGGLCGKGLVTTQTNGDGVFASISCNPCSCWNYLCESCRCVCPVLCVTTVNGSQVTDISRTEKVWDEDEQYWGDAYKWISIRPNADSLECEWYLSDWDEGDYDPEESSLSVESCGGDMSYFITTTLEDAIEAGEWRYEFGTCKQCEPDCFGPLNCADCCTDCENPQLPALLYFDLIGRPVAGGEEPPPDPVRCIEVYDIPLTHRQPLFAEAHRWEGRSVVSCGCPQSAETPDPAPDNYSVEIVVTCSGETWTISVTIRRPEGQIGSDTITDSSTKTASFSCSPVAWTGELELGGLINANLCCCDLALTMDFAISE